MHSFRKCLWCVAGSVLEAGDFVVNRTTLAALPLWSWNTYEAVSRDTHSSKSGGTQQIYPQMLSDQRGKAAGL